MTALEKAEPEQPAQENALRAQLRSAIFAWLGLLGLTLLTSLLGLVNLGAATPIIAIVVAVAQASLIALFLMHALRGSPLVRVVAAGGVLWFLIMMLLTLTDYVTRGWLTYSGK